MSRCRYCTRWVWPWQRQGWIVGPLGTEWFHTRCYLTQGESR